MSTPARRVAGALVSVAAATSVIAAAVPAHAAPASAGKVPTKLSNSLKVGQKFVLTLPACVGSCGDSWKVLSHSNGKVQYGQFVTHESKSGETQVITFKGRYTGTEKIVLAEYGPGRVTTALRTLTINFTVSKA